MANIFRAGIIFKQLLDINEKVCTVGYWLNYELHQKYGVMNEHQLMELTYIINLMVNALHSLQVISLECCKIM